MLIKKRHYILLAVLSYVFFTLSNVPASKVISLAEQQTSMPVKFYGVHGSLWNGGAQSLLISGQPPVDNLQWSINPLSLLLAKISSELSASIKNQNIVGNLSLSALGTLQASDVRARIDSTVMQELLLLPFGELDGVFNIDIRSAILSNDALPVIDASINWKNARLTVVDSVNLGQVDLHIQPTNDNKLSATLNNKQGELLLKGNAEVDADKAYSLDLLLTPQSNTPQSVTQSLGMFSRRQSNGSYQLKRKGNLSEFGI